MTLPAAREIEAARTWLRRAKAARDAAAKELARAERELAEAWEQWNDAYDARDEAIVKLGETE